MHAMLQFMSSKLFAEMKGQQKKVLLLVLTAFIHFHDMRADTCWRFYQFYAARRDWTSFFSVFDESLQRDVCLWFKAWCFSFASWYKRFSFFFVSFASLPERRIMAFIIICMHIKTLIFSLSLFRFFPSIFFLLKTQIMSIQTKYLFQFFEPFEMEFCNQWYFQKTWFIESYVYVFMWLWIMIKWHIFGFGAIQLLSELIITSLNMWNYKN